MKKLRPFALLLLLLWVSNSSSFSQQSWNEVYSDIVYPYTSWRMEAITSSGNIIYAAVETKVYKWDGSYWTELQGLNADSYILTMTTDAAGNLYAAGWFTNSNGKYYVAKWNGTNWSELGGASALSANGFIKTITVDAAGNIYAAGSFRNSSGRIYVAKYNGANWSEVGAAVTNFSDGIQSICADANGNLYAGGFFKNGSNNRYVSKFNGTAWSELGGVNALAANGNIRSIATDAAGNVYCAGEFGNASNKYYVAKFDGSSWSELGGTNALNANHGIHTIITGTPGNIYVAGSFDDGPSQYVAKYNGTTWSNLGNFNFGYAINVLTKDAAGNIYAAGDFKNGTGSCYVNKWTATSNTWAEINSGGIGILELHDGSHDMLAIISDAAGNIYAAGNHYSPDAGYNVHKWDGHVWSPLGIGTTGLNAEGHIYTLASDAAGNIYAAGRILHDYSNHQCVSKWDGTTWKELGAGGNELSADGPIYTIAIDAANNVYAGGALTNTPDRYNVWKWNGTSWATLGTGANALNSYAAIQSIKLDQAGNVYTVAERSNDSRYVAKWNGTTWTELGAGAPGYHPDDCTGNIIFDKAGNLFAQEGSVVSNDLLTYVIKWDGTSWTPFTAINENVGKAGSWYSDAAGNLYFGGLRFDNEERIDKWDGTSLSKLGNFNSREDDSYVFVVAPDGKIYSGGSFKRNGRYCGVVLYDSMFLSPPAIADIDNKCVNDATAKGKVIDPPSNTTITVTLDGTPVTYSPSDNTFTYFTNAVTTAGNHTISVKYANSSMTVQKDSAFTVNPMVMPAVSISGNLSVPQGQSTTLTVSVTHGGPNPTYQWQDSIDASGFHNLATAQGSSYNYSPAQTGHRVRCIMTSNAICASQRIIYSQSVQLTVTTVPTAINPVPSDRYGIRIYPNPASSILIIDSLRIADKWQWLVIHSIDGKKVMGEKNISNKTLVSQTLAGLQKGIYIISLRKKNGEATFYKLVKE